MPDQQPKVGDESYGADTTTTVAALRRLVAQFVSERNWQQFHSPKNLSMSLAIEAAELMEHFQWLDLEASRQIAVQPDNKAAIGEELADCLAYVLAMANTLQIDLATTLAAKMQKNAVKYPAGEFRGRAR